MRVEEISLGKTDEEKASAILRRLGNQVILKDFHEGYMHAVICDTDYDDETYYVVAGDRRGKTRLHYDDLQQLFVLQPLPENPLPEIRRPQNP